MAKVGRPRMKAKDKLVNYTVCVPPQMKKDILEAAELEELPPQVWMRRIIRRALNATRSAELE